MISWLCSYNVFFLFSSTKIGHGRPSVKDRYAISDKNILRSYVVRYFYLKFLACHSSMPLKRYKKKEKKMCSCAVWSMAHRMFLLFLLGDRTCPLVSIFQILMQFVSTRIFHHFFSYSFLYSYFFSRYLSAGRHAPLRGADGKADRRKVPAIIRRGAQAGVT